MPASMAFLESSEPSVGMRTCLNMVISCFVVLRCRLQDASEAGAVQDAHVLLLHFDEAVLLEEREQAAHGLELEAEVAADLLAGHPQVEIRGRVAAAHEALGKVGEEGCEALFCAHGAEEHHHAVVADDF